MFKIGEIGNTHRDNKGFLYPHNETWEFKLGFGKLLNNMGQPSKHTFKEEF